MECPRDSVEMRELLVGSDDTSLQLCDTCGGIWIDSADLNRLLLHRNLPGLESMGGRINSDGTTDRCPRCQVDLTELAGGEKGAPEQYAYCEACAGIWLDLDVPEGADADEAEADVVDFFQRFRKTGGSVRSARP